jgi:hypothetical protein
MSDKIKTNNHDDQEQTLIEPKKNSRKDYVDKISNAIKSLKRFNKHEFNKIMYEIMSLNAPMHIDHETELVYNGTLRKKIKIDKQIANLMEMVWANGIKTCNSCEDNVPKGYIWIEFLTSNDLQKFLDIVFEDVDSDDNLYERAFVYYKHKKDAWQYDTGVFRDDGEEEGDDGTKEIFVTISLRFPFKDKEFIQNKLTSYWRSNCAPNTDKICQK